MVLSLLVYCILGVFVGILAGLLGVGGGLILVPVLLFLFPYQGVSPDVTMHMALGTSMASIIFTSISSSFSHYRRAGLELAVLRRIVPGILIGTYVGSMLVAHLPAKILQIFFLCFLCFVAWQMLFGKKPQASRQLPNIWHVSAVGFVIGSVSSFAGVGGGAMSMPYMLWHNVPIYKAIGTSAAIGFFIAIAGSLGYFVAGSEVSGLPAYSLGYIYLPALAPVVFFSMLTAPLGTRIAHKLPVQSLKKCFAVLLIVMAVRMFIQLV